MASGELDDVRFGDVVALFAPLGKNELGLYAREGVVMKIAFIGLGNMGGPMAANLAAKGYAVTGFDIVAGQSRESGGHGVEAAASAEQAVQEADAVITMVPAGQHVLDLYRSILGPARPDTLFIDCSTIDVASAREAHDMAQAAHMQSLDAPVSGGTAGAAAATLTFMAGGEQAGFRAQPSPSSAPWASASSIAVRRGPGRPPRSATT